MLIETDSGHINTSCSGKTRIKTMTVVKIETVGWRDGSVQRFQRHPSTADFTIVWGMAYQHS